MSLFYCSHYSLRNNSYPLEHQTLPVFMVVASLFLSLSTNHDLEVHCSEGLWHLLVPLPFLELNATRLEKIVSVFFDHVALRVSSRKSYLAADDDLTKKKLISILI